jgi:Uma2 family endonuclease
MTTTETLSPYELERGKPMPSFNHSIVQLNLGALLKNNYGSAFTIASELMIELNGKDYVPDISVYPKREPNWQKDEVRMLTPPLIAIQIASPSQGLDTFESKLEVYFKAGIKSFWLVQPFTESLTIFLPNQKPKVFTTGDATDETTGITISVSAIFAS